MSGEGHILCCVSPPGGAGYRNIGRREDKNEKMEDVNIIGNIKIQRNKGGGRIKT